MTHVVRYVYNSQPVLCNRNAFLERTSLRHIHGLGKAGETDLCGRLAVEGCPIFFEISRITQMHCR